MYELAKALHGNPQQVIAVVLTFLIIFLNDGTLISVTSMSPASFAVAAIVLYGYILIVSMFLAVPVSLPFILLYLVLNSRLEGQNRFHFLAFNYRDVLDWIVMIALVLGTVLNARRFGDPAIITVSVFGYGALLIGYVLEPALRHTAKSTFVSVTRLVEASAVEVRFGLDESAATVFVRAALPVVVNRLEGYGWTRVDAVHGDERSLIFRR